MARLDAPAHAQRRELTLNAVTTQSAPSTHAQRHGHSAPHRAANRTARRKPPTTTQGTQAL
ncbi:hypothetical protein BZL30_4235 [Mycobacterium kansasii]|uniref:Uncharacterized protein n=1 Tax=Mycobacterium kansasii TaxID=1768 RepID=A0A1V3WYF0_MYCKA|nr:hypothetical protein BZL29_5745 [Mycobacterium kansasii]OOK76148.1 hypothetical protein BZL30_4235 [Mycobacterium kansasii]